MQAIVLLRYWREAIGVVLLSVIAVLWLSLVMERRSAAKWQKRAVETQSAFDATVRDYRAKAEQARLADLANKHRVEADYARIQSEKTNVQNELAATRARLDSLLKSPRTNPGSSGAASMPGASGGSSGSAGTGDTTVMDETDKLICEINTLTAEGWREWYERVRAVPR